MAEPEGKRNSWADLIRVVRTPLGFFTLAILIVEGLLLALAINAKGADFTLLLWGMLVLAVLLVLSVLTIAVLQSRSKASAVSMPLVRKAYRYDVFISAPMASAPDDYKSIRELCLGIAACLRKHCGMKSIYLASEKLDSVEKFNDTEFAATDDLDAIEQSRYFVLLYPKRYASSALVEVGYALCGNTRFSSLNDVRICRSCFITSNKHDEVMSSCMNIEILKRS